MHFSKRDLRSLAKDVGVSAGKQQEIVRILKKDGKLHFLNIILNYEMYLNCKFFVPFLLN